MWTDPKHIGWTQCMELDSFRSSYNLTLQIWTRLKDLFCNSYSIDKWDDYEYIDTVDK